MRLWLLAGLVACGDNAIPISTAPTNGSRLHTISFKFDDGARLLDPGEFFDTAIGRNCTPKIWSDGLTYCTPDAGVVSYRDATCTEPVDAIEHGFEPPAVVIRPFALNGEDMPSRMYRLGAPTMTPPELYRMINGECVDRGAGTEYDVYEANEIDPVAIETVQLGLVTLRISADGMRVPIGFADSVVGVCEVDQGDVGPAPCRPAAIEAEYFANASCNEAEAAIPGNPADSIVSVGGACGRYFKPGIHVGPFPLFQRVDDACVESQDSPDTLYALGPEIHPPTIQRSRHRGEGTRLQQVQLTAGDESVLGSSLFDPVIGAACRAVETGQGPGIVYCAPETAPSFTASLDPECGNAIQIAEAPDCGSVRFSRPQGNGISLPLLLADVVELVYVRSDGGACVERRARPGNALRLTSSTVLQPVRGVKSVD